MSRRQISETVNNQLEKSVLLYRDKNKMKNLLTKEVKGLGDYIKKELRARGVDTIEFEGVKAQITSVTTVDFNMEYAIEILKESYPALAKKIIYAKEVINEELLEAAIYNDPDFAQTIKKAFTEKEQLRLNIK